MKDEKKMIFDNCEKLNRMICNSNNNECSQCSSSEENDFDQFYFKLEKTIRTLKVANKKINTMI